MTASFWPILIVDVGGSVAMIVFAFLAIGLARRLRRCDPQNVINAYLFWVCMGLVGFAISRSAGHILKQFLVLSGHRELWAAIGPVSGAINSFMFVFVASVTLFFERVWEIYRQIAADKAALQRAHGELLRLNENLEEIVRERTQALEKSERRYRRIFEVSRDMILVVDARGTVRDMNFAGRRILGFEAGADDPRGELFERYFAQPSDWERLRAAVLQDGFALNVEAVLRPRDGSGLHVLISAGLDRDADGGEPSIHLLARDIQERHLMREQMAQAERLASIGQLSAGIAHEINNPLGIILGYTQLLLRAESADSERRRDLKVIEKHVRHCKSIVEDLLNFARRAEPEKEAADIHRTIEEALALVGQHRGTGRIEFRTEFDPRVPPVVMDAKKIQQVLVNLLMNARYAVGEAGTISVRTAWREALRQVEIQVADNGHGIEARHLKNIFDPFFTTKPTGEGTGLGLSVSYGIVKKHGGDIRVKSESGRGAAFTVVLPVGEK